MKLTKKLKNRLLALGLAGAIGGGSLATKDINFINDSTVGIEVDGREMDVPMYSLRRIRPGRCSAYARMAAEELFGEKYSYSNGWDRRYNDSVVTTVEGNRDLEGLETEGILKPGMIIGAFYPGSPHLGRKDSRGNKVVYTHNFLYLGRDGEGNLTFAAQEKARTLIRRLDEFGEVGIEAREIITPRDQTGFSPSLRSK